LLIALVALLFVAASCGKSGGSRKPTNVDYYTCTMHPSVKSQTPGKCPICSMDLVPVMKRGGEEAKSQASPQTQDVKSGGEMKDMPGMPGMKTGGETKGPQISEIVEKDAPLMSIYSPDLLTSEREFVELLRMRDEAKTKDARETPEKLIES